MNLVWLQIQKKWPNIHLFFKNYATIPLKLRCTVCNKTKPRIGLTISALLHQMLPKLVELVSRKLAFYTSIRLNANILNLVDVIPEHVDYRVPTHLFNRHFTHSTKWRPHSTLSLHQDYT